MGTPAPLFRWYRYRRGIEHGFETLEHFMVLPTLTDREYRSSNVAFACAPSTGRSVHQSYITYLIEILQELWNDEVFAEDIAVLHVRKRLVGLGKIVRPIDHWVEGVVSEKLNERGQITLSPHRTSDNTFVSQK